MYQIITYDRWTGVDECREYSRRREAVSVAKRSLYAANTPGTAEGAIVYDLRRRKIADIFGHFPERYRPTEA